MVALALLFVGLVVIIDDHFIRAFCGLLAAGCGAAAGIVDCYSVLVDENQNPVLPPSEPAVMEYATSDV